jgi:hypothetical protein
LRRNYLFPFFCYAEKKQYLDNGDLLHNGILISTGQNSKLNYKQLIEFISDNPLPECKIKFYTTNIQQGIFAGDVYFYHFNNNKTFANFPSEKIQFVHFIDPYGRKVVDVEIYLVQRREINRNTSIVVEKVLPKAEFDIIIWPKEYILENNRDEAIKEINELLQLIK